MTGSVSATVTRRPSQPATTYGMALVSHLELLMKCVHCQLASTLPYRIPDNVSGSHCEISHHPRRDVAQRVTPCFAAPPKSLPGINDDGKRAARNVCFRLEQRFLEGQTHQVVDRPGQVGLGSISFFSSGPLSGTALFCCHNFVFMICLCVCSQPDVVLFLFIQYYNITILKYCNITILQYYNITILIIT